MLPTLDSLPLQQFAVVLVLVLAAVVVRALDDPAGRWRRHLRTRFVAGVPWGTLVTVCFVLLVYLFVQGGFDHWYTPMTIPFTAWSYTYPLGMVTAPFAHSGPGHLVGNLIGTLTYGILAEYAWGHYPRDGDTATPATDASHSSLWQNPRVRAFVVFPAVSIVVGLATSVFGLGPIIGFSGVVFAFAGFALVSYPFGTVLALVVGNVVRLVYSSFLTPVSRASSQPVFSTPWFADIAIQGHAFGILLGVLLGIWLTRRRGDDAPSALRLWTGVLLFAVSQSLWAVYWFRGNGEFVLYRAGGVALVVLLATLVTAAVRAGDTHGFDSFGRFERLSSSSVSHRPVAVVVLLVAAAALAGPAVGVNLLTSTGDDISDSGISVRDYDVTYAENVENRMVAVADVDAFGESTTVNTSGVIVRSEQRNIWITTASKSRLAFAGRVPVRVGGIGWRETVVATRDGWEVAGGDPVYRVRLRVNNETTPVFASDPSQAEPVLAGQNVSLAASDDHYSIVVGSGNETNRGRLPAKNETVTVSGIEFTNEGKKLVARTAAGTEVRVATRETYN